MAEGLVSVVVTSYNVAPFLRIAVDSALRQTYRNLEVLVIDDGSQDNGLATLQDIRDPRLKIFPLPHRGPVHAMNSGMERASGEFVSFLDGDDIYTARNLERQIDLLRREPRVDLTFCQSRLVDEDGADLGPTTRSRPGPLGFSDLLADNLIGNGSAVVARREALGRAGPCDTGYGACYDLDLWLRIALQRPGNIRSIPEVGVLYRRRRGQLTGSRDLMEQNWRRLIEKMRRIEPETVARVESRASANMYRYFAFICYEQGSARQAMGLMLKAIRLAPAYSLSLGRTYLLLFGIAAGAVLPAGLHQLLDRRIRRGTPGRASQSA